MSLLRDTVDENKPRPKKYEDEDVSHTKPVVWLIRVMLMDIQGEWGRGCVGYDR
jgi:hypothetical protein